MSQFETIISQEDVGKDFGYLIERSPDKGEVFVTFWFFERDDDDEYQEKRCMYNSMNALYQDAKVFVESDLINHSPLHIAKYKMMTDYIKYYEGKKHGYALMGFVAKNDKLEREFSKL